ncbi:alpha-1,2-mannosidase-like protein [Microthyrium microscopicum]|uniref:Alpha-1,2-mannosidase-like protein n=1 Tax=Microthyrium microscopicum TaxID=703497 RepID=A0A6A6U0E9_9PEZI|nr:alpha-1,2-mannosidase-like protein [Microthyrium microscopicum]
MYRPLLAVLLGAHCALVAADEWDPLKYVDPLIGSQNGGNVFSGASIPYGLAKPVADTNDESNQGGFVFNPQAGVTGFGNLHDSGTGGSPSLGNFQLFPYASCPGDDINRCNFPKKARAVSFVPESVVARPGHFAIKLGNGVSAEMSSTHRTSIFEFDFPAGSSPLILMDLTDLSDSRQDNGTVTVDPQSGRMKGGARFLPSFGTGNYQAYFCVDFHGASIRDNGIFVNSRASTEAKELTISRSINGYPLPGGAFVRFANGTSKVRARVGLSFISSELACYNGESEIPQFDLKSVIQASQSLWREKLKPIRVDDTGVNSSFTTIFYSGIYRTMINPQDYTGENPLWKSDEPYFDSFYCLWDSFRSQIPFLILFDPVSVSRMIRSLIDTYVHDGWLPDCRMTFSRGYTQGGSNADVILADAYLKGISQYIDWNLGYKAVVKDAEEEPFDWCCHGRGGLDSWKTLGYIPVQDFDYKGFGTMTRSLSRTLEYAYNDFTISLMASKLGKTADTAVYVKRSQNWANLFNSSAVSNLYNGTSTGFTGFFQPKYLNKTWGYQNPLYCSRLDPNPNSVCSLQNTAGETFESSIWEYGFYVPHNQAGLMQLYGGQANFVQRLNYLHDQSVGDISNEPSFLTVFQYHYAGRPGLSARRSHFYIPSRFSSAKDGIPGNDDSGAMGSFTVFNMMGIFPNPGQDVYFIIPPYFRSVNFTSPLGNATAKITIENFDPTYHAVFIQNATLNGQPYTKNWLSHSFFLGNNELVLRVGTTESTWGTHVADVPPSLSDYPPFSFNGSDGGISSVGELPVSSPPREKPRGAQGHHLTNSTSSVPPTAVPTSSPMERRWVRTAMDLHRRWRS